MKIAFFIHNDYNFTFDVLHRTIAKISKKDQVVGIIAFPDVLTKYSGVQIPRKYLEIFGLKTSLKLAIFSLWKRFLLFEKYLCGEIDGFTFSKMASRNTIEYRQYRNPNDPEVIDWVKSHEIDVIFIFVGHILKKEIIESPKCCIINKHSALLPANRGILPVFWAMLNNEKIGYTLHQVTEKIDYGEILFQKEYGKANLSLIGWYERIYEEAPDSFIEVIRNIREGHTKMVEPKTPPSYHSLPTRDDVIRFEKKGLRII